MGARQLFVVGLAPAMASTHQRLAAPLHSVTVSPDIVKGPQRLAGEGYMESRVRAAARSPSKENHWFRK